MPEGPFGPGFNPLEELVRGLAGGLEQAFDGIFGDDPDGRDPAREDRRAQPGEAPRSGPPRGRPTPKLNRFGRDLTADAHAGRLDPVIGRDDEVGQLVEVLARRTKNNPVLLGDPGVGKTAIVEGLASRIADGTVPEALRGRRIISVDLAGMVAGTKYRGEFEQRLTEVIDEVVGADRQVVLFLDELHTVMGAGSGEGSPMDAANMLKPALARGGLQVIGATTMAEYRKHIERDAALDRRFQPITIAEPSVADTVTILRGLRGRYQDHHRVTITDEACEAAAALSERYLTDRFLPDKAIDLMDRASARVRMRLAEAGAGPRSGATFVAGTTTVSSTPLGGASNGASGGADVGGLPEVDADAIAEVVAAVTGIPVARLTELDRQRLLDLEITLRSRVVGQDEAVEAVADAVRAGRAGLTHPDRPVGSFLFMGPTGVGKTELARALAEALFGAPDRMVRLDMSEFAERHSVSRLTGAPPGYVGHDEPGQLTDAVRRNPYSVVLLDEIEKAHADVLNVLLGVLDAGRLTDTRGRTVNFTNTVVIMTSNLGAEALLAASSAGRSVDEVRETLMASVRGFFRPEFLNRLDEVVLFAGLGRTELRAITGLLLAQTRERLAAQGIGLTLEPGAVDWLAARGHQPEFGARPLRRAIGRSLERRLSRMLLAGELSPGQTVRVDAQADADELVLEVVGATPPSAR
ncbi:MAG TPA: ATP-dependent Clp protease ATP-binding subunit [Pseudonocardia sp.]|nr:ATP-dependent Clp protease ATP-binding subunit [Pseudonocardia sp.]